jgi:SAM-dependent methyltransferase
MEPPRDRAGLLRLDDPETVRREYETEERFLARRLGIWAELDGPVAEDLAAEAISETEPETLIDVGCGPGEFAVLLQKRLQVDVVALDQSLRMAELARDRGLRALRGDIQQLPFGDGLFDVVVAIRVLYHLPDLDRGLAEIRRVLRPGGRLVAVVYGRNHLRELWSQLGTKFYAPATFAAENGGRALRRHFERIERRDATGRAVFSSEGAIRGYLESYERLAVGGHDVALNQLPMPLVASYHNALFVAVRD